jgi:hypothetical protein
MQDAEYYLYLTFNDIYHLKYRWKLNISPVELEEFIIELTIYNEWIKTLFKGDCPDISYADSETKLYLQTHKHRFEPNNDLVPRFYLVLKTKDQLSSKESIQKSASDLKLILCEPFYRGGLLGLGFKLLSTTKQILQKYGIAMPNLKSYERNEHPWEALL